ncbi:hypothetical protein G7085_10635 [Tessaracoccus sp. HDW20]|uniref:hypothetical protein n=1 Tax=Tessaracoccus coleopterorum TaxID=2714950 RepID=UPI0018D39A2E|nr:hypothetical protein [Tessaracoccus coleopterorum]NHB84910.1 hypothetical protein [Tessaracoccus coleopterorum]
MTKWKTRDDEPSLSGIRDRVLLLLGFVSALRASELAALEVDQIKPHERGLVIELTHSKTNQTGDLELVVLPGVPARTTAPSPRYATGSPSPASPKAWSSGLFPKATASAPVASPPTDYPA